MVAIDSAKEGGEGQGKSRNEVKMHGKKIPRAHKLPKSKKTNKQTSKHTNSKHHIKWGHVAAGGRMGGRGEWGRWLDSASGQTKRTRVNYTFGYLCINTLAVGGNAKGGSSSRQAGRQLGEEQQKEEEEQWANCCFASGLKFNWLV